MFRTQPVVGTESHAVWESLLWHAFPGLRWPSAPALPWPYGCIRRSHILELLENCDHGVQRMMCALLCVKYQRIYSILFEKDERICKACINCQGDRCVFASVNSTWNCESKTKQATEIMGYTFMFTCYIYIYILPFKQRIMRRMTPSQILKTTQTPWWEEFLQ